MEITDEAVLNALDGANHLVILVNNDGYSQESHLDYPTIIHDSDNINISDRSNNISIVLDDIIRCIKDDSGISIKLKDKMEISIII